MHLNVFIIFLFFYENHETRMTRSHVDSVSRFLFWLRYIWEPKHFCMQYQELPLGARLYVFFWSYIREKRSGYSKTEEVTTPWSIGRMLWSPGSRCKRRGVACICTVAVWSDVQVRVVLTSLYFHFSAFSLTGHFHNMKRWLKLRVAVFLWPKDSSKDIWEPLINGSWQMRNHSFLAADLWAP